MWLNSRRPYIIDVTQLGGGKRTLMTAPPTSSEPNPSRVSSSLDPTSGQRSAVYILHIKIGAFSFDCRVQLMDVTIR